jgi:hypothetical protein
MDGSAGRVTRVEARRLTRRSTRGFRRGELVGVALDLKLWPVIELTYG